MTNDPITAQYYILTYDEVQLERLVSDDGTQVVNQTVLVLSPHAKVQVLDVYPTGGDAGFTARVAISEPALRSPGDGSIVPLGHLAEIKAQEETRRGVEPGGLVLPATLEGGDTNDISEA